MENDVKSRLLEAAKPHVVFDGWTTETFHAAVNDSRIDLADAQRVCPNGAIDLAVAFHKAGDAALLNWVDNADLADLRYSEKVARLVCKRLQLAEDKELVRRGLTLFSMPQNSAQGASLVWGTADAIWSALGDTSDDLNWYSKRAILSGVYGSSVLFWLGDQSAEDEDTRAFVDRRISNVMQFEKFKGQMRANAAFRPFTDLFDRLSGGVRAPSRTTRPDYPGWVSPADGGTKG